MLGPLTGGSPGGREIGRLRTRGVWEIGGIEGPGPRRSPGLPPRTLFFPQSPKKTGSESAQVLKSYYVPTLLVLWGRNRVAGPPFSAVFKVQRRFPRNLLCSGDSPPGTFGVFSGRCFREMWRSGNREIGQGAEGRKKAEDEGRRRKRKEERRKMTDGERRQWAKKKTVTYDRR